MVRPAKISEIEEAVDEAGALQPNPGAADKLSRRWPLQFVSYQTGGYTSRPAMVKRLVLKC